MYSNEKWYIQICMNVGLNMRKQEFLNQGLVEISLGENVIEYNS